MFIGNTAADKNITDKLKNRDTQRRIHMSEQEDKTPEQVSDEDYKVAPTSADEERLKKHHAATKNKEQQQ